MYWLAALPVGNDLGKNSLHNTYYWELTLKYTSSVLYATPMITADNFRFERTQWKNTYIMYQNPEYSSIIYSFIEKDSIDFLLDNWFVIQEDTIPQTEAKGQISSLDLSNTLYKIFSPYDVVLIYEDNLERVLFTKYLEKNKEEFFAEAGNYDPKKSSFYEHKAQAFDPEYIHYLCQTGKIIVKWLEAWRKMR